jgi:hypothetical protein
MRNYLWSVRLVYIATGEYSEQYDPAQYLAFSAQDAVNQSIASGYWGDANDMELMAWVRPGLCAKKISKER